MIRNFFDYQKYVFRIKKKDTIVLLTDVFLFVLSVFALMNDWSRLTGNLKNNWSTMLIIIGVILKFSYDVYKMADELKGSFNLKYGKLVPGEFDLNTLKVDPADNEKYQYEILKCSIDGISEECVMNSKIIDQHLITNQIRLNVVKSKEKQIFEFIRDNSTTLLPFLQWQYRYSNLYGKMFFNEQKLCLSKDIDIKGNIASCHRGSYYDTYLTNIICGSQLKSNKDDSIISSVEDYLPIKLRNEEIYIKDITSSIMNNEIGISTLAVTSDNYLVLWTQNRMAQASNGLLVPTGSGSCDWKDKTSDNFGDVIIGAMKRELWEESGRKHISKYHSEIGKTIILGHFKWVNKAGKPEFVGLTKVNSDLASFVENKREVYKRVEYHINRIEDIKRLIGEITSGGNISVPLYMNLLCLERYYDDHKEKLAEFIGI